MLDPAARAFLLSDPPRTGKLAEARLSEDSVELRAWAARIGGRYTGAPRAEEYGARNGVRGELLVRAAPTRVTLQDAVAG